MRPAAGLEDNPAFVTPMPGLGNGGLPHRPSGRAGGGGGAPDAGGGLAQAEAEQRKRRSDEADAVRRRFVAALVAATGGVSWSFRLYLARTARASRLDGGRLAALAPLLCSGLSGALQEWEREAGAEARCGPAGPPRDRLPSAKPVVASAFLRMLTVTIVKRDVCKVRSPHAHEQKPVRAGHRRPWRSGGAPHPGPQVTQRSQAGRAPLPVLRPPPPQTLLPLSSPALPPPPVWRGQQQPYCARRTPTRCPGPLRRAPPPRRVLVAAPAPRRWWRAAGWSPP